MKITEFVLNVIEKVGTLDRKLYRPFYSKWHTPWPFKLAFQEKDDSHPCYICLAGAWAACKGANPREECDPMSYNRHQLNGVTDGHMYALDSVRKGHWISAALDMKADKVPSHASVHNLPPVRHRTFTDWEEFDVFLKDLKAQALLLQAKGY